MSGLLDVEVSVDPIDRLASAPSASARLRPATRREWEQFLDTPGVTAFHGWGFLQTVAPAFGCRFVPLLVLDHQTPVGIVPLLIKRRAGVGIANNVPFDLGPLVDHAHLDATLAAVHRWCARHAVVSARIVLHPTADASPAPLGRTAEDDGHTYVIDLAGRSRDDAFAALPSKTRTAVRRAGRNGVTVRRSTRAELVGLLPELQSEAWEAPQEYAAALGRALADSEESTDALPLRCATALLDGEPIGISITVGGRNAAGWVGAVRRSAQPSGAMTALVWDAMAWAIDQGYPWLDMLGAPDEGIATFKRRFAPRVLAHPVITWESRAVRAVRSWRKPAAAHA